MKAFLHFITTEIRGMYAILAGVGSLNKDKMFNAFLFPKNGQEMIYTRTFIQCVNDAVTKFIWTGSSTTCPWGSLFADCKGPGDCQIVNNKHTKEELNEVYNSKGSDAYQVPRRYQPDHTFNMIGFGLWFLLYIFLC